MPYIENRIVHDADAHTMELPNWFDDYADKNIQKAFRERFGGNKGLAQTYFENIDEDHQTSTCLLYTSPSPRDRQKSRMPSSA